jgi:hypothetical protein
MRKIASLVAAASPRLDPVSRRREETDIAHEVNLAPSYQKLKGPQPEVRAVLRLHTRRNRSGKDFFNPFAIRSMFTRDTFLTPRSTPL